MAVSPHSQLLIAAGAVGAAIVLTLGALLVGPEGLPGDAGSSEPSTVRITVLDPGDTADDDAGPDETADS